MDLIPNFSWTALLAGHRASHKPRRNSFNAPEDISGVQRHVSALQEKAATAEQWIAHIKKEGRNVCNEALGAGTPLVCTYLLGWTVGTSRCGLFMALAIVLLSWGTFLWISLTGGDSKIMSCVEMWTLVFTAVALLLTLSFIRVRKRTPEEIPLSRDDWQAICLETLLASTAFCFWDGLVARVAPTGKTSHLALDVTAVCAPFVFWCAVRRVVRDRQRAFLKANHLAVRVYDNDNSEPLTADIENARSVVHTVFKRSRDLQMIGLSDTEFRRVASYFESLGTESVEAKLIYFHTQKVMLWEKATLQREFHRGYEYIQSGGGRIDAHGLRAWIHQFLDEVDKNGNPLTSILGVAHAEMPLLTREVLEKVPCSFDDKVKTWWLCGAIARTCDDEEVVVLPQPPSSEDGDADTNKSHQWYALFAAALNENQNPLARIHAIEVENLRARPISDSEATASSEANKSATKMSRTMRIGCEQILRQAVDIPAEADNFYVKERGLVLTTTASSNDDCSPPTITYSAGEVWQAELAREPVMLTEGTFNSFWRARKSGVMSRTNKDTLWRDNAELSSNVVARVDFKDTLAFLRVGGKALANAQAAAWRGWLMHSVWAMCTLLMQLVFPQHVPSLSALALLSLPFGRADQYAHFVFVATHLWRFSPLGRACLASEPMSDADIDDMVHYGFLMLFAVLNLSAASSGNRLCAAACIFLLLASVAPGLWFFHLGGNEDVEEGSDIVVKYVGRSRGTGYAHRDSPTTSRPVGRDALENTTSVAASANGGNSTHTTRTEPVGHRTPTARTSVLVAIRTARARAVTAIRSLSRPMSRTTWAAGRMRC